MTLAGGGCGLPRAAILQGIVSCRSDATALREPALHVNFKSIFVTKGFQKLPVTHSSAKSPTAQAGQPAESRTVCVPKVFHQVTGLLLQATLLVFSPYSHLPHRCHAKMPLLLPEMAAREANT